MKLMSTQRNAFFALVLSHMLVGSCWAEVTTSAADGFQIKIEREVNLNPQSACQAFIDGFSNWWDASHSYSGKGENLSLDLEKNCMLEKLSDGGYARHMEIVHYQPGQVLRMTGGLGPLQEMGVHGALTFTFEEADGKTRLTLKYNVTGSSVQHLDKIAGAVDGVLASQMDSFQKYAKTRSK